MKRLTGLILIIGVIAGLTVLEGCKKGDKDPFFSFRSRKARVAGDWVVDQQTTKYLLVYPSGVNLDYSFTITGTSVNEVSDTIFMSDDSLVVWNGVVNEAYYEFDKNGQMIYVLDYTLSDYRTYTDPNTEVVSDTVRTRRYTYIKKGTWNFMSNVEDEYKNKERIAFVFESVTENYNYNRKITVTDPTTDPPTVTIFDDPLVESGEYQYANGEAAEVWELEELKSKEIIMKRIIDETSRYTINLDGETTTRKGTETQTLKPKQKAK